MERLTSPQDKSTAEHYIDLLRQNQLGEIEKDMDPSLEAADMRDTLSKMAALFPAQRPVSVKVVGMKVFRDTNSSTTNITLEYEFPDKWLLAHVATRKADGAVTIIGFHVSSISDSLEHYNRFTLVGKSANQYLTLCAGVLALALSIYAFVVCVRTQSGKGRWLWSVICLLGVGQFGVDWTTGLNSFTPLAIHLPPAGATAPLYGAWVVYVNLPLGALLFLCLRDRLNRRGKQV